MPGKRQWADKYGSRWYLHRDGTPPHDDENSYEWTGTQWALVFDDEDIEGDEFADGFWRS